MNNNSNNPFKGMKNCLGLFNNIENVPSNELLDRCLAEALDSREKKQMFFSLLFSMGDVTSRQHNIFNGKKVDNGGNSNREGFYQAIVWLFYKYPGQFERFLKAGLFNEYSCFDVLFRNRVKSTRKGHILQSYNAFSNEKYNKMLLDYVYSIINGNNTFNKMLIAKFLTIPRTSKRQGHTKMLPETKILMNNKARFLYDLSNLMGWETKYFKGYREWRRQYNQNFESVLFSTGEILNFSEKQFIEWYDQLPALARTRVFNRVNKNEKWQKFRQWIVDWQNTKEQLQAYQRELEEKVRQGTASDEDTAILKEVKKEAKVTVGATSFFKLFKKLQRGDVDPLKLETFINKVNLPYNSLTIIDDSGSMSGFPFMFACFLATICMTKNPDDNARNLVGFFSDISHWHSYIDSTSRRRNSLLRSEISATSVKPLIDPTQSFYTNFNNFYNFALSTARWRCTNLNSILGKLVSDMYNNPQILDELKKYPIWTLMSDGEFNSCNTPHESLQNFFTQAETLLGFKPFLVLMDVWSGNFPQENKFEGIDNVIYIPSNPAQIEQFLTNFKDMETFDVYTPLLSLYRSNRYELVRQNVI